MSDTNQKVDPASNGQILSIATTIEMEIAKALEGKLSKAQANKILGEKGSQSKIKQLARYAVGKFLDVHIPLSPEKTKHLKLISGEEILTLDACNGSDVITSDNKGPFDYVDGDFVDWEANEYGSDTTETEVGVYEMTSNANFQNLFGSFSTNLDDVCMTTSQIKNFCTKFRNWLRTDGYSTFFLFKSKGKFFVADVSFYSGELEVYVNHLSDVNTWYAGCARRIVLPATKHLDTKS